MRSIDADPVLKRALELMALTNDQFGAVSDVVTASVSEFFDRERTPAIRIENFDRYRMVVDSLLQNDTQQANTRTS